MPSEQHGLNEWSARFNLAATHQNELHDYWEAEDLLQAAEVPETPEEQDDNMWNEGLNLITEQNTGPYIVPQRRRTRSSSDRQPIRGGLSVSGAARVLRRYDSTLHNLNAASSVHARPHKTTGNGYFLPCIREGKPLQGWSGTSDKYLHEGTLYGVTHRTKSFWKQVIARGKCFTTFENALERALNNSVCMCTIYMWVGLGSLPATI